jgi:hypothetical protein
MPPRICASCASNRGALIRGLGFFDFGLVSFDRSRRMASRIGDLAGCACRRRIEVIGQAPISRRLNHICMNYATIPYFTEYHIEITCNVLSE